MVESERGAMAHVESEKVREFNVQWNLRELARRQRMEYKFNRVEGDTHAIFLPQEIEEMAEEFPDLELTPFQKRLLYGSLGAIQKRVFENAIKERDSGQDLDPDGKMAMTAHIESTLLQVYSFLHGLEVR